MAAKKCRDRGEETSSAEERKRCSRCCGGVSDRAGGLRRCHVSERYGMAAQAVSAQTAVRRGPWAICGEAPGLRVDQDDATGRPRGMLCFNGNGGLGQFKDDPVRLARAIDYSKGARWTTALEAPGVYRLCS